MGSWTSHHRCDHMSCAHSRRLKNPLTSENTMVLMVTENFFMLCSEISAITKQRSPELQSSVCENPITVKNINKINNKSHFFFKGNLPNKCMSARANIPSARPLDCPKVKMNKPISRGQKKTRV